MDWSALVERDTELRLLGDAWRAATLGTPQLVLVEGPAGVGKSALLARFLGDRRVDATTLRWAGDPAETALPFGLVGQLLPEADGWVDPFTAGRDVLALVGEVASAKPVVLAFDDLHLADRPSLIALNFAIRRMRHDAALIVCTARTPHSDELPQSMLRAAADSGHRVRLDGLTTSGTQEMAVQLGVGRVSRPAAERLRAVTGGNPLHLRALLREVPLPDLEDLEHPLPAPGSFAKLVLTELDSLDATPRRVAAAAAVLGERTLISDLAAVADVDVDTCVGALTALARSRLLRTSADGRWVEFDHPLVRAATYADLGPADRSVLHRRAAGMCDGYQALQHRIAATVTTDAELAEDLYTWATEQRRSGSPAPAAAAMLAAHRVTAPGPEADSRLLEAVEAHAVAGNVRAALQHLAKIEAMPASGRRLAVQARVAWMAGRTDDAAALAREAWEHDDLGAYERDLLAALLAQIEILRDHQESAVAWADRALSERRLDAALAAHTRAQRAYALALSGRLPEAFAGFADLPEDPSEIDPHRHPEVSARGHLRMWSGPPAAAQVDLAVAASLTQGDLQPFRLTAAAGLVQSRFHGGDWDRSLASAEQLLALAEDMEQTWVLGILHALAAWVPTGRGAWETAERHVDASLTWTPGASPAAKAYAEDANAFLAVCRADPHGIIDATERLRRTAADSPQRNIAIFSWPLHLVVALVNLGRLDEADAELQHIMASQRQTLPRTHAAVLRVAGQLAAARRDHDRARRYLTEAVDMADDRVDALEQALALEALGRLLRRRGQRRAAVERLRAARQRFVALRAEPFIARCGDELAACGVHDPTDPRPLDPLTPQERIIATLICAGRTNQQAADELVLSQKTISFHLTNVYAKLGVHTRAQLMGAMHDLAAGATRLEPPH